MESSGITLFVRLPLGYLFLGLLYKLSRPGIFRQSLYGFSFFKVGDVGVETLTDADRLVAHDRVNNRLGDSRFDKLASCRVAQAMKHKL